MLLRVLNHSASIIYIPIFFRATHLAAAFVAAALLIFSGCASNPKIGLDSERQTQALQQHLRSLNDGVDQGEAERLATAAVEQAISLAREYRAVRPPWIHNVLVNNGFRERGLCFEWTNDLFERLYGLKCQSLELHLAVARMDTRREHNAIVVTARGAPFETGIILDAWRSSGRLWFGAVATDKYPWVALPEDRVDSKLQELMGIHPAEEPSTTHAFTN